MNDIDLRGIVLNQLYKTRRQNYVVPTPADFGGALDEQDVLHIVQQLEQHKLVGANISHTIDGRVRINSCRISALGIDVVENGQLTELENKSSATAKHYDKRFIQCGSWEQQPTDRQSQRAGVVKGDRVQHRYS